MKVIMNRLSSILLIINLKSLIIAGFAVLSTWVCLHFDIRADFPLTMISTAIVFPIVFSIGHAYKRRENALDKYGALKAHGRALYYAARDWLPTHEDADRIAHIESVLDRLMRGCRDMFKGKLSDMEKHEVAIYVTFSELSEFVKHLRADGLPSGECSRANQYVGKIIVAYEGMKHIFQYRTPRTLRAFSDFFIVILPILYGPFFAHEATSYNSVLIYVMPILFAIILVGLDNIQDHLEDPFDQVGEDDITINVDKFVAMLSAGEDPEIESEVETLVDVETA